MRIRRLIIFASTWVVLLSVSAIPVCLGYAALSGDSTPVPNWLSALLVASVVTLFLAATWHRR